MTPLRARLMNPPNAVADTGINMRNGAPVRYCPPKPQPVVRIRDESGDAAPVVLPLNTQVRYVILAVSKAWGVMPHEILQRRRLQRVVIPRHAALAIIYRLTSLSSPQLARYFNMKDHAGVLHAIQKMHPHIMALDRRLGGAATIEEWVLALKARLEA
jgi:hypothetical protein